jgi:hypothetical protein
LQLTANVQVKATGNYNLAKSSLYFGNNAFGGIAGGEIALCHSK